ncbi:MAG: hypothetical protein ABI438_01880 [Dermatophilaceae bacterium]
MNLRSVGTVVAAEYVRVPFADTSTYAVPAGVSDEEVLMLDDFMKAYDVFSRSADTGALKVVLTRS